MVVYTGYIHLQHIEWMFRFRFFIVDVFNLLKRLQQEQEKSSTTDNVYRGQLISLKELTQLKESIGGLISFNSFLSTSQSRSHTLFLLGDHPSISNDLCPILFEIYVKSKLVHPTKPFADITAMSAFQDGEKETLFMIGSTFRLENTFMEGNVTVFTMCLVSENDSDLKTLFEHMRNDIGIGTDDTLLTLGTLLFKGGRFQQAEQFYCRMINELPWNHQLIQNCYQGLGLVAAAQDDYHTALKWQMKVLENFNNQKPINGYQVGCTWNSIGNNYWRMKDYDRALDAYFQAKELYLEHNTTAI